jgi:hypothetical protein
MRATKNAAPQPWRRHGLVTGIPLALLIGVPACRPPERLTVDGTAGQPDVAQSTGVRFARH